MSLFCGKYNMYDCRFDLMGNISQMTLRSHDSIISKYNVILISHVTSKSWSINESPSHRMKNLLRQPTQHTSFIHFGHVILNIFSVIFSFFFCFTCLLSLFWSIYSKFQLALMNKWNKSITVSYIRKTHTRKQKEQHKCYVNAIKYLIRNVSIRLKMQLSPLALFTRYKNFMENGF